MITLSDQFFAAFLALLANITLLGWLAWMWRGQLPSLDEGLQRWLATLTGSLNKKRRSPRDRRNRALLLLIAVLLLGLLLNHLIIWRGGGNIAAWALVLALALYIDAGPLPARLWLIARRLTDRYPFPVDIPPSDAPGRYRLLSEWSIRRFQRRLCAPLVWTALFGWLGLLLHYAVYRLSRAAARWPEQGTDMSDPFTAPIMRLAALMDAPGRWLATLLFLLAGQFTPGFSVQKALAPSVAAKDPYHRLPALLARGFSLAYGGPLPGRPRPWLGQGRAQLDSADLARLAYLLAVALLLLALLLLAPAMLLAG